jgi:hydrogenase maturation factor HypF (carbamoyltransferase family)
MSSVTSESVMQKFEILPESAKKEVADFIDRLLQKRPPRKRKLDKKKLLEISQWTEEDIKVIEEAGKEINKWRLETF